MCVDLCDERWTCAVCVNVLCVVRVGVGGYVDLYKCVSVWVYVYIYIYLNIHINIEREVFVCCFTS